MKVFRTQLVLVFFSVIIFIFYFQSLSNPRKDALSLAVFLFIPFFIIGILVNYFIIKILEKINKKYRFLNYMAPLLLFSIVPIVKEWKFSDFYFIIGILFFSNSIGYFFIKDE